METMIQCDTAIGALAVFLTALILAYVAGEMWAAYRPEARSKSRHTVSM